MQYLSIDDEAKIARILSSGNVLVGEKYKPYKNIFLRIQRISASDVS